MGEIARYFFSFSLSFTFIQIEFIIYLSSWSSKRAKKKRKETNKDLVFEPLGG